MPHCSNELLTHIGSDGYLLFATDFPHLHVTDAMEFLDELPERLRHAGAVDNVRDLYGFD